MGFEALKRAEREEAVKRKVIVACEIMLRVNRNFNFNSAQ